MGHFFLYINHGAIKINYVTTVVSINSDNYEYITIVHNLKKKLSIWSSKTVDSWSSAYINVRYQWRYTISHPVVSSQAHMVVYNSIRIKLSVSEKPITGKSCSILLMYDTKMFRLARMLLILTCIIEKPSICALFSEHICRNFVQYSDNCPGSYDTQADLNILLGSSWPWHSSILSLSPICNSNGSNISESWYLWIYQETGNYLKSFLLLIGILGHHQYEWTQISFHCTVYNTKVYCGRIS